MTHAELVFLFIALVLLIFLSGFFSGSETGMMAINRYRLRHRARSGVKAAQRVAQLLTRPDRLLSVILIGNTFANILAASIVTVLALELFGEHAVFLASIGLTLIILVFAEIIPKTVAALHPSRFAFMVSRPLGFLLKVFYPIVWLANITANRILRVFGVDVPKEHHKDPLSRDELRSVVQEAKSVLTGKYSNMLLGILDLQKLTVNDIMVPRSDIVGVDVSDDWEIVMQQLSASQHTRLPIYKHHLNDVQGVLHVREILHLLSSGRLTLEVLLEAAKKPYFVPKSTPLYTQLLNFQQEKRRSALVVDEYGDIQGLVTLEDILEEIVGEFTTDVLADAQYIHEQADGSYIVDGGVTIREFNRTTGWGLPIKGPKTISGLLIGHLQAIPNYGTCIKINNHPIEVTEVGDNMVKVARVYPSLVAPDEDQ